VTGCVLVDELVDGIEGWESRIGASPAPSRDHVGEMRRLHWQQCAIPAVEPDSINARVRP
jgi:hypothetical protein